MTTSDPGSGSFQPKTAVSWQDKRRVRELMALHAVSVTISQNLAEPDALRQVLTRLLEAFQLDVGGIYLLNPQTGQGDLVAAQGANESPAFGETTITSGVGLCGLALQDGGARFAVEPAPAGTSDRRQSVGYAVAAIPLLTQSQKLGVLRLAARRSAPFDSGEVALLSAVAAQLSVAIENMRLREAARRAEGLETLIQEMHHRIKNNLQTVADLLSLELSAGASPEARHSLRDSISRIKSIAAVHQLLSVEQLRLADITELARQVCDVSLRQLTRPDRPVVAEIHGPPIYLPSKQATALALVMNELIANALEHAFETDQPARLHINLEQEGPRITVTVADNGRGLPADFSLERNTGLGLQIAHTLVEKDLFGTLQLTSRPDGGCEAVLTFYR